MKQTLCAALLALATLPGLAAADPGDDRILAARDAANRGDAAALGALAASSSDHPLEPYVQYWWLANRLARTQEAAPAEAVRSFLARNAGSWLAERLRLAWVKRAANEGNWAAFEADYGLLMQPDNETLCWAAQSATRMASDAQRALDPVWATQLDLPAPCDAPLATVARQNPEIFWARFRRLVEARRFSAARAQLALLPEELAPNPAAAAAALENPARHLTSLDGRVPAGRVGRELVLAAVTRLARSDVRDAAQRWRAYDQPAMGEELRACAWGQLALLGALSRLPEAGDWFARTGACSMSEDQYAWRARVPLRAGDWAGVRRAVESMPDAMRETADWTYWLGRALAAQGDAAGAQQLFLRAAEQPNFYGILATEALGRTYRWPRPGQPASSEEVARAERDPGLSRARALYRLDLRTDALREWNWALRGADDRGLLAAAELARRTGLYDRAINAAERTRSEHDFGLRYLAPYYESFAREASLRNLDLSWVYGLTRQESRFQPVVRSGAGAQGLMQVMPTTGSWIAKKMGWSDYQAFWLTDIDRNVRVGSAYLRHVLDLLNNNPVLASAAYNAGPGRARRWRDVRPLEGAIFAETIPISETRDYVKKVMANAEMYATLFEARPVALGTRMGIIPGSGTPETALAPNEP